MEKESPLGVHMEARPLIAIAAFVLAPCGNSALAVDFDPAGQQSAALVTEQIDPCQVIPAADVEAELGIPVVGKADLVRALRQGQPTQIRQASCVYRPTSGDSVQLTVRILPHDNPQQHLEARRERTERLLRRPGAAAHRSPLVSLSTTARESRLRWKEPYRYILHAAIRDFHKPPSQQTSLSVLDRCLDNIFALADELGLRSLAIPLLGTGGGGLDQAAVAARIALRPEQHGHFSPQTT